MVIAGRQVVIFCNPGEQMTTRDGSKRGTAECRIGVVLADVRPESEGVVKREAQSGISQSLDRINMTVKELSEEIERGEDLLLLDVREPEEYRRCRLPRALLAPLSEFSLRILELDPRKSIVVYCHHGIRSSFATSYLRRAGFRQVRNLAGGIEAWATEIDPQFPRY